MGQRCSMESSVRYCMMPVHSSVILSGAKNLLYSPGGKNFRSETSTSHGRIKPRSS